MKVEIVDAIKSANGTPLSGHEVFKRVKSGELQMSQTYTTYLGNHNKSLWVLDLPFLFRDHNHASKVLDGPVGARLLANLDDEGVKGLSFTYSGGFRIISTIERPIQKMDDFMGQKIRVVSDSPVAAAYLRSLGAIPVVGDSDGGGKAPGGVETTYARLEVLRDDSAKFLNETEHSLFLTSVIINKTFFDSLPPKFQRALREVAIETAKIEREDAIQDGILSREKFVSGGMKVVRMEPGEQAKLKEKSKTIYSQFYDYFGKQLIADIQNQ